MRVLGVDPGLTRCGIAVVDISPARKVTLVHVCVVRSAPSAEIGVRLHGIEDALATLITQLSPDAVAVERVFSQLNVRTVVGTAQAAGIAALLAHRYSIPLGLHTPSEVKAAVTGSGRADKNQVATMVNRIVGQRVPGPADATDAVALAICHGWRAPGAKSRIDALSRAQSRGGIPHGTPPDPVDGRALRTIPEQGVLQ